MGSLVNINITTYFEEELFEKQMLRSLEIRNYRNLRHLTIEKLGRVNLLVGKNNTGKTSVLEAMAIYASWLYESITIKSLLQRRGEYYTNNSRAISTGEKIASMPVNNLASVSSLFTDYKPNYFLSEAHNRDIYIGEQLINGTAAEFSLLIGLRKAYQTLQKDESGREVIDYVIANKEEDIGSREFRYEMNFDRILIQTRYSLASEHFFNDPSFRRAHGEPEPFQYVDSKNQTQQSVESLYSRIALSEKEDDVIKALRIIEPQVVRYTLTEESGPIVSFGDGRIRKLSSMGDGMSRIFSIILSMVNCEGTYLLIDEFENGLHYSVQEKLWEIIFYLAKRLNIQVFATTHSIDCVEAFSTVLNGKKETEGVMIRLENYEGNIEATVYDADEVQSTTRVQVDPR